MGLGATEKPLVKRRPWSMLRIILVLIRKGLVKRRYLQEELMKRARLFAINLRKFLMSHDRAPGGIGGREYEFSCSNSPAAYFRNSVLPRHRHWHSKYFSCIYDPKSDKEYDMTVDILHSCNFPHVEDRVEYNLGDGEDLGTPVSHNSNEGQVDREAEEFIARFYSQIKFQRQISLLRYEEMLSRGVC